MRGDCVVKSFVWCVRVETCHNAVPLARWVTSLSGLNKAGCDPLVLKWNCIIKSQHCEFSARDWTLFSCFVYVEFDSLILIFPVSLSSCCFSFDIFVLYSFCALSSSVSFIPPFVSILTSFHHFFNPPELFFFSPCLIHSSSSQFFFYFQISLSLYFSLSLCRNQWSLPQ